MNFEIVLVGIAGAILIAAFMLKDHPQWKWLYTFSIGIIIVIVLLLLNLIRGASVKKKEDGTTKRDAELKKNTKDINDKLIKSNEVATAKEAAELQKIESAKEPVNKKIEEVKSFNDRTKELGAMKEDEQIGGIIKDINKG